MNKIYALLVFLVLLASACKDPCKDINCNNGACLEGTCFCDNGYEGVNCDKEEREKFIGTWVGDVDCGDTVGAGEATFIVSNDPSDTAGLLFELGLNILDLDPLEGTVAGNKFFITSSTQSLEFEGLGIPLEITISGDGEFNDDNTVTMNIVAVSQFITFNCSGVLVAQ